MAEAFRLYNTGLPEEQQINIKTAYAKVNYDRQKMLKIFPEDMLTDVVTRKNPDMSHYEKLLNLAVSRYSKKSRLLDKLALRIPRSTLNETLTDDELDELYSIIAPYSRHHIRAVEAALPEKMSGYLIKIGMPNSVESVIKDIEKRDLGYLRPMTLTVKKPAKSKP